MGETVCDRKESMTARSETASPRLRSSETEFAIVAFSDMALICETRKR